MIQLKMDFSGVEEATRKLVRDLSSIHKLGRIMRFASSAIWVPNISGRLLNTDTSTSGYQAHLNKSMYQLDPAFVERLAGQSLNSQASIDWALQTEAERRVPGGYKPGEISQAIDSAIRASQPTKVAGIIAVGIGDIDELNNLFPILDEGRKWKLWEILQYGTGAGAGKGDVVRVGKQIFFSEKLQRGIITRETTNPGFKGREYFVQLDGTFHESDYLTRDYIIRYMEKVVKKYSAFQARG
jgi:hypothetical protein